MQHCKHKLKCLSVAIARRSVALALLYEEKRCPDLLFSCSWSDPWKDKTLGGFKPQSFSRNDFIVNWSEMSRVDSLPILQSGLCALRWATRGSTDRKDQLCVYHAGHIHGWHLGVRSLWIDLTMTAEHSGHLHTLSCCHLKYKPLFVSVDRSPSHTFDR